MTETPHRAQVSAAITEVKAILSQHELTEKERQLLESLLEDVNLSRHKMPPPTVHVLPKSVKFYWMGESVSMSAELSRETLVAEVRASRLNEEGIVTKVEGNIEPESMTLSMRSGRPVEPYEVFYFSVPDEFMELVREPEMFSDDAFQPRLELGVFTTGQKGRVVWAWNTDYYDGPLSGYCYVDGELCSFHFANSLDYSQERIFEVRGLAFYEKLFAHIRHGWFNLLMTRPLKPGYFKWHNKIKPALMKKFNIQPYYKRKGYNVQEEQKKLRERLNGRPLKGYFTW